MDQEAHAYLYRLKNPMLLLWSRIIATKALKFVSCHHHIMLFRNLDRNLLYLISVYDRFIWIVYKP